MISLDPLAYSYDDLSAFFALRYGKGECHAGALFRDLYRNGTVAPQHLKVYGNNRALAERVRSDFSLRLPEIRAAVSDGRSTKLLLVYPDGAAVEAVLLFMSSYATLCLSTQVGCARACAFCATGRLGLIRSLSAGEIVAQVMAVRFLLGIKLANLVYMGMGEPFDNYGAVRDSIRIISDQRGLNIAASAITLSTAGHGSGIRRLTRDIETDPDSPLGRIKLALSLHAARNSLRSQLMPINRAWPLEELKAAISSFPLPRRRDRLFIEYSLIPGLNDGEADADELVAFLSGIPSCVNIIPCNPGGDPRFRRPSREEVERFFNRLIARGQYCRVRDTKGDTIQAACGQLGALSKKRLSGAIHAENSLFEGSLPGKGYSLADVD